VRLAYLGTGTALLHAVLATALITAMTLPVQAMLRLLGFDPRLERAADVLALSLAVLLAGALPGALLVALWMESHATMAFVPALLTGGSVLGLGMLLSSVAVLALDRGVLQAMQPGARWWGTLASTVAVGAMIGLLWMAPRMGSTWIGLALFLPHLVVGALALKGQLALAGGGLLAAALLAAGQSHSGFWLWAGTGGETSALGFWLASALALMLVNHAAAVNGMNAASAGSGRWTARAWVSPTGTCSARQLCLGRMAQPHRLCGPAWDVQAWRARCMPKTGPCWTKPSPPDRRRRRAAPA
jgi:hypothetical protein